MRSLLKYICTIKIRNMNRKYLSEYDQNMRSTQIKNKFFREVWKVNYIHLNFEATESTFSL